MQITLKIHVSTKSIGIKRISGRNAENNVQTFWEKNDFKVGMGRGFFTHQDKIL